MSLPNYPDSQKDVISSATHLLYEFEQMVAQEMPGCAVVYDEELSYESGVRSLVAKGNYNASDLANMPIFIYNRSVMRNTFLGLGLRTNNFDGILRLPTGGAVNYTPIQGEFDINFMYVSKSVKDIEDFEIVYLAEEGISNTIEIPVNMADLGDFTYFLNYGELSDKQIVKDEVYYKAVLGSIVARGHFFTFRSTVSVIESIKLKIMTSRNLKDMDQLLAEKTIPE